MKRPSRQRPRSGGARPVGARPGAPHAQGRERKSVPSLPREGDVYLCSSGFERTLSEELRLGRGNPPRGSEQPAVVVAPKGTVHDVAFARQVLPRATLVEAVGPSELADELLRRLGDDEGALLSGRALLHVFPPDFLRRGSARPEPHPLSSAVDRLGEVLSLKIEGRARKRGVEPAEGAPERLVQVLLVESWRAWLSTTPLSQADDPLRAWPALFPGGHAPVDGYEDAPSSAYRKLVEALAWLRLRPGEPDLVLDLGAAPGGWSYVALANGARVVAYDRADLDPGLATHPRLTHVRQDAFSGAPLDEATWLLCDVIDAPARSLELIERALAEQRLRALVVTVKLKPPIDLGPVRAARALAAEAASHGWQARVKHLVHNKHEVTFLARREGAH